MCFFYLIEHSKFLLHTLQGLYMCTLCDSTNINMIIEFVLHASGDGFNGGSDSYLQFRDTHAPCLLKLCIPPSNGIVRWWLFPEFGAVLALDNCTPDNHFDLSCTFAEHNQQNATFHNLLISIRRSTCFRRVFCPSSAFQNCIYSIRYLSARLAAGSIISLTVLSS